MRSTHARIDCEKAGRLGRRRVDGFAAALASGRNVRTIEAIVALNKNYS